MKWLLFDSSLLVSRCWHQSKFSPFASSWNIHHHLKRWQSHLHNEAQKEKGRGCVSRDGVKVLSPPFRHFLLSHLRLFPSSVVSVHDHQGTVFWLLPGPFFPPVSTFIKMELSYWVVLLELHSLFPCKRHRYITYSCAHIVVAEKHW